MVMMLRHRLHGLQEKLNERNEDMIKDTDGNHYADLLRENRILNQLIKQYESTMDVIMAKFRAQTVESQPVTLIQKEKQALQNDWNQNLMAERNENMKLRKENILLSEQLEAALSAIRNALQASSNEDEGAESEPQN
ncbi:hypothetical protein HDU97_007531 [Phlyctochytrium planicorne]|nr:hypothetical protein HDU97_007531 [Phlyctochytrium planicorne]